jgi:hypothetical protein
LKIEIVLYQRIRFIKRQIIRDRAAVGVVRVRVSVRDLLLGRIACRDEAANGQSH